MDKTIENLLESKNWDKYVKNMDILEENQKKKDSKKLIFESILDNMKKTKRK